jgi:hypothetical protein
VIPQKGAPGLRRRLSRAHHIFRDRGLTDVEPEFQQFAMNSRGAPTRIGLRHRANQRTDVRWHGRSPHATPALQGPPEPEASSVPGDDGLRLDDDQRRSPSRQHTRARPRANGPPARDATAEAGSVARRLDVLRPHYDALMSPAPVTRVWEGMRDISCARNERASTATNSAR